MRQTWGEIAAACILAWMVPGAGHLYLRKLGRAAIFFACILSMFSLGLSMQGELVGINFNDLFSALKFFADIGVGLPYFVAGAANLGMGQITAITFDYGNIFLYGAGLLNMLIVLDAFDIAMGRKN